MAATPQHTYQVLTKRHGRMRSLLQMGEFFHLVLEEAVEALGLPGIPWPLPNVWIGVSVEDQKRADLRIPALLDTPASVRFLSCEPLLGPVDLTSWIGCLHDSLSSSMTGEMGTCGHCAATASALKTGDATRPLGPGLHWVIVGGESGPGARPMDLAWARALVQGCRHAGVPVFVKQLGSVWARHGKGGDPDTWPTDLSVRKYPASVGGTP
jgi:protein gp37